MCEKCIEIDRKIDHYKWIATQVYDGPTRRGIDDLIQQHQAEKRALHPEEK